MYTPSGKFEFADSLALQLSVQLVMSPAPPAGVTRIEKQKGVINRKALGYIYGFIDSGLQSQNQDIADYDIGLPTLRHILRKLFPQHGKAYLDYLTANLGDDQVKRGMAVGKREYADSFHSGETPFGLAQFILDA